MSKRILPLLALSLSCSAFSDVLVDIELGTFIADHNRVQIPNDSEGDRFNINDIGADPFVAARLTLVWLASDKQELQVVLAPFPYTQVGNLDEDVVFVGESFSKDETIEAGYQFSSYRLRYLYKLVDAEQWQVDLGATLFLRDARIKLSQNGKSSEYGAEAIGVVPLLAVRAAYAFNQKWSLLLDTDSAFAPKGRALDIALLAQYRVDDKWQFSGGYRTIEGGANSSKSYNFAWFNGVVVKSSYAW